MMSEILPDRTPEQQALIQKLRPISIEFVPFEKPAYIPAPTWNPLTVTGLTSVQPQRGPGNYDTISGIGTANRPLLFDGHGRYFDRKLVVSGDGQRTQYLVLRNAWFRHLEVMGPTDKLIVTNCQIGGISAANPDGPPAIPGGGLVIAGRSDAAPVFDVLVHGCSVDYNGNWLADFDEDVNGIRVGGHSWLIHIVSCDIARNSGDGVSLYGQFLNDGSGLASVRRVYVYGCTALQNKQTGFWSKQSSDCVFAQNYSEQHLPMGTRPSAWGAGMGYQYGPERLWFINNRISKCCFGIQGNSTSGEGSGQTVYLVANQVRGMLSDPRNPQTGPYREAGFALHGVHNRWLSGNYVSGGCGLANTGGALRLTGNAFDCTDLAFTTDAANTIRKMDRNGFAAYSEQDRRSYAEISGHRTPWAATREKLVAANTYLYGNRVYDSTSLQVAYENGRLSHSPEVASEWRSIHGTELFDGRYLNG